MENIMNVTNFLKENGQETLNVINTKCGSLIILRLIVLIIE